MFGVLVSEQGCWMKLNIGQDTASFALINPLNPDFNIHANSHLLFLYVCYRSSGENSLKYQLDLSGMIMSSLVRTKHLNTIPPTASAQELCVYLLLNPFGILLIPIKEKRVLILRIKKNRN